MKIRGMKKILLLLGIIVILFSIILFVAKDSITKSIVSKAVTRIVGVPVTIDKLSLGLFDNLIQIEELTLYNPPEYPEGVFVNIAKIIIHYDLSALLKKGLHLYKVYIDLKEVVVVKNKNGKLNVEALKVTKHEEEKSGDYKESKERSKSISTQIDTFTLSIGQVVYKDFSRGDKPSVKVYNIGMGEKEFKDIPDTKKLVALILAQALKPTAIKATAIYGIAGLAGAAVLPLGAAIMLVGEDSAKAIFDTSYDRAYKISMEAIGQLGHVTKEDKSKGLIKGKVKGNKVTIKISEGSDKNIEIILSARKILIPKPKVAKGVLYQISEQLQ